MKEALKENINISERLVQAYNIAKQAPDHKSMVELPEGSVYIIVNIGKPPKRSQEEIDEAIREIKKIGRAGAQSLKEKGLALKDILKDLPKIRSEYNKEHYGIETDAD